MSSQNQNPIDIRTIAIGFVLGLGILVLFIGLGTVLDQTFLVNHAAIPHQ
ncbi:MAG: hypothetical protein IPK26_13510 [Planctomycetes bacterium]|nr:hypothetical protein [Planctomycetota bacterium]